MGNNYPEIQELLQQKADYQARLNLMPYDGSPEVKEQSGKQYIYIRKRVAGRLTSEYVDVYSVTLYQTLLRNARESRELKKQIRRIEKQLAQLGYAETELPSRVLLNIDFARTNMKANIYDQAVLEGVATTFPQTEDIIENGKVNGVTASDVQKILNLKHAWEFIMDKDVVSYPTDYSILCHIARLVNEGFYTDGGRIRGVPVTIGGTSYIPPLPFEQVIIEQLEEILGVQAEPIEVAIRLCSCKIFSSGDDGNLGDGGFAIGVEHLGPVADNKIEKKIEKPQCGHIAVLRSVVFESFVSVYLAPGPLCGFKTLHLFIRLRKGKPNLAKQPDEKILQLQGLVDHQKPTVVGIMMLGEYPQAYFPQLSVTAMVVDGTEMGELGPNGERFIDNQRIEGTLTQMLEDSLAFVRRNTRNSTIVDGNGNRADRSEYPMVAVREIILNALIHRDYSVHTDHSPIRIVLYRDRLEVENPGGLYGRITIDELGKAAADTRNPFIAGGLEVMLGTENRFSGIPTVMSEMKKAGLPPAVFESRRGVFRATLYNGRYHTERKEEIGPVSEPMRKILLYCTTPRSRNEIAEYMGVETPSYIVRKYLRPLLEKGKLRLLIPDAPKSKNQRYLAVLE